MLSFLGLGIIGFGLISSILMFFLLYGSIILPILNRIFDSYTLRRLQENRSTIVNLLGLNMLFIGIAYLIMKQSSSLLIKSVACGVLLLIIIINFSKIKSNID